MSITVKITEQFKSIGKCEFTLPNFCVLTGKNGSGKTHLLWAMSNALQQSANDAVAKGTMVRPRIIMKQFGQFNPSINEICYLNEEDQFIEAILNCIPKLKNSLRELDKNYYDFLSYVQKQMNLKNPNEVTKEDLKKYFDVRFLEDSSIFSGKLALIFKNYARLKEQNTYNRFRQERGQKIEANKKIMSDDEFVNYYGIPPWELINNIFKRVDIPYFVNNPENDDRDDRFVMKLYDRSNKDICVNLSDLSTGEQALMSLAMAIYNSDSDSKKPDVLLLDEPDAGLHPSMSKSMISIIREFIVEKLRVPVVITTHSPTTIAALSDIEIYEKVREIDIPRRVTKEEALSLLTSDIPFLTVSME